MTKSIKKITYLIVALLAFLILNISAQAATLAIKEVKFPDYIYQKDVVTITATKGNAEIAGYYVGAKLDTADFYKTSATSLNVSMMNGMQYVWVKDVNGNISSPYAVVDSSRNPLITKSCTEQPSVKNATGSGVVEKCMVYADGKYQLVSGEREDDVVVCASGYSRQSFNIGNYCVDAPRYLQQYNLNFKYCRMNYQYNCVKASTTPESVTSFLSSLSISSGSLSPAFNATTYTYSASVNVSSLNINASIPNDGSSFVQGYGSRSVNLNYGKNTLYVKVKSKTGNITTYTINVTRVDNRNKDNTLKSLTVNKGTLSPAFNSSTTKYTVNVDYDVTSITVGAEINNSKSSFVKDFGPRTVDLKVGDNKVEVKVKSQSNATKTYTITVNRKTNTVETPVEVNKDELALLRSLKLSEGNIDFKENVFEYTLYVDYNVTNVFVEEAKPKNSKDTVTYAGGENLVVGVESIIMITVEDTANSYVRTYSVNVIRKEEDNFVSTNSEVSKINIKNHSINFEQSKQEYEITLRKGETELDIEVVPEDSLSTVAIEGNQDLKMGSEILITVTAEDGSTTTYTLKVTGVTKGTNVFLVVILVVAIILVIGYIILRLLGYKVVINLGIISDFFRGLGQKIKNIFDR